VEISCSQPDVPFGGAVAQVSSKSKSAREAAYIRSRLLRWARQNGRDFPWRHWRDPYRLLVTEILLKQTRALAVSTVIGPFFDAYPTAESLHVAGSALEELIQPLGFGSQRAEQLRRLAADLVKVRSIPTDVGSLQLLPGIGPYAAGMVAASLGSRDVVAVDTNVGRVVCRVFGTIPSHAEVRKSASVWEQTGSLLRGSRSPVQVLWAILDLAASTCRASSTNCAQCPLQAACLSSTTRRLRKAKGPTACDGRGPLSSSHAV
jgi:A/G-specific adenine glycosylase